MYKKKQIIGISVTTDAKETYHLFYMMIYHGPLSKCKRVLDWELICGDVPIQHIKPD